ncbi:HAD-superfamily hydrolase, subfamily IA, variant 1 [Cellulomonas flavigena DSM 20109]|uniref:HAD-superfamily hydrolase, subfamily IA, variant 1 n=1 Tax=Cellulomonas flavigena (strain ATCC 482 / DSM 20109 / BCRC 11376 / JCM 18109 / NBRC 3775 / NCIMB 8073 / NRS 134) TaxID=446466 RepID=D5UDM1_CELFN|nr:HAD family hydrolase [Cellulomonas flavigena]ADG76477.1 HAD-superfamily hydrolase, subfamily IA, variant 1 [Cellulomonas flavigena DSM 20109]
MRPAAVLFDAGLTLIHASGDILVEELARDGVQGVDAGDAVRALVLACEARHVPMPVASDGTGKVVRAWCAYLGLDARAAAAAGHRALAREDLYDDLDTGAHELLGGLRDASVRLGVVSNSEGTVRDDLRAHGLLDYFEVVLDSTVVGVEKPDPEIFRLAADALGVAPAACWYVGDGVVNDVLGARAAGYGRAVLFDRFDSYARLPGVCRVRALPELLALVGAPEADLAVGSRAG